MRLAMLLSQDGSNDLLVVLYIVVLLVILCWNEMMTGKI